MPENAEEFSLQYQVLILQLEGLSSQKEASRTGKHSSLKA